MPVFDFSQFGSNLLRSAQAARRAFGDDPAGHTGSLGGHTVQVTDRAHDSKGLKPARPAARRGLLSRLVQVWQGRASTRVAPAMPPGVSMRRVSPEALQAFKEGLDKARAFPEELVRIEDGPSVAATFKKDLSRSNYFLANRSGRPGGDQINVVTNQPTDAQLAKAARSILERLGNDLPLFQQVTQFAQQGGLTGLPAMQGPTRSPVKLNGYNLQVMDAAGGGRTDNSHKTYAIGLRREGVAVVNVRYSNQNVQTVLAHRGEDTVPVQVDPRKSRLDAEFTVEIERGGTHRILGGVRLGSIIVPVPRDPAETAPAVAGSAPP